MNPVLKEIIDTGYTKSVSGQRVQAHSAISCEEGKFLQELIFELNPKITLEIGLAYGVSSLFICEALAKTSGARHIILDPDQLKGWGGIGLNNLRAAGYEGMVEFYDLPAHQILPKLLEEGRRLDFAFIDGWHLFDYALVDFFYIDKMLKVGGVVVFHDTNWPAVLKLCRYISTNRSYTIFRSLDPASIAKVSRKRFIFNRAIKLLNSFMKAPGGLFPRIIKANIEPSISSSCIAFRKEAEDERLYNEHHSF